MFGIADALLQLLLQGQRHRPAKALEMGLVDELVPTREDLVPAAKKWIAANPEAVQPWDVKGHKIPGGTPSNPKFAANLPAFPANLRKQIKGANYPAPHHIMAAAVEGAQVDFDTAIEIEGRYFVDLVTGQVAKNMIQAFFFDLQAVNGNRGRPEDLEPTPVKKVVVLGAGMMGAAIAYVCAKAGIEVVLKDVDQAAADKGKDYSVKLVAKGVERGKTTQEKGDKLLALITADDRRGGRRGRRPRDRGRLRGPEGQGRGDGRDRAAPGAGRAAGLEHLDAADHLAGRERLAGPPTSSACTSSAPWTRCRCWRSSRARRPSDAALYRALDFAKQIGKTPIVVNDSRGFFTSRVIGTFINEGMAMLAEGIPAPSIEQASSQAGYPAPVLQLSDELNMKLMRRIRKASKAATEAEGGEWVAHAAEGVIDRMLDEFERPGKLEGAGFYEYADGKRTRLWPGLREAFPPVADPSHDQPARPPGADALHRGHRDRQVPRRGRIESVADANIGSIMGIGFPGWTGGVLQYINGYEGGVAGLRGPRARARGDLRRALHAARVAGGAGRARRGLLRRRGPGRRVVASAAAPLGAAATQTGALTRLR